ncbi:hypothetical protein [Fibrobacter sp. UWH1]|uniref:hypothetical protein n=1 Tax=Fibrobacter sp. UWH1 TaxID=1964354 RepID=UPI001595DD85|nr:hypothetical protein [Fibrobacter sp. UWH1]
MASHVSGASRAVRTAVPQFDQVFAIFCPNLSKICLNIVKHFDTAWAMPVTICGRFVATDWHTVRSVVTLRWSGRCTFLAIFGQNGGFLRNRANFVECGFAMA